jgi:tRNA threonylcarbamoyladenosine biosynthesis protein TsaB
MVILALDTSSAAGSTAVVRDGVTIAEHAGDGSRTHGERLPGELMAVLDAAGVALADVDQFAVCIGPGSFTGLRVGIATIQGLALARNRLVVPVSSFEAIARPTDSGPRTTDHEPRPTAVWIDAHRGEVFATLIDADGTTELIGPSSLPPAATIDAWSGAAANLASIRFAGNGAIKYADAIRERLGSRALLPVSVPLLAPTIGRIAHAEPGRGVHPHAIAPLYIRRPDAELARDRRRTPAAP